MLFFFITTFVGERLTEDSGEIDLAAAVATAGREEQKHYDSD